MTMINARTFIADGPSFSEGQGGTVEVTLHGMTKRVAAHRDNFGVHVQNISGRLKGGRKVWNLRLFLRHDGREDITVWEVPAPNVEGKVWAELGFGRQLADRDAA